MICFDFKLMRTKHRNNQEGIPFTTLHLNPTIISFVILVILFCCFSYIYASQSIITESEGRACMEKRRTRTQVEESVTDMARRNAIENAIQYLKDNSTDSEAKEQLLSSLKNASVKIINMLERKWTNENGQECFSIAIQAEVIPEAKITQKATRGLNILRKETESTKYSATMNVEVWTDRTEYKEGDEVTIFLKGNKPFYARVIYRDASGNILQLLPNPYRSNNYFEGDTTYRIPSDYDKFKLEVSPPFGHEEIIVYASTSQLGEIELESAGDVYSVKLSSDEIARKTRGVGGVREMQTKQSKPVQQKKQISEFSESSASIRTKR
jgi:hypothetical protein